ncbi:conserved hypothetical protein [Desulforapulum autotrophicum HRM2]|uniref:DUF4197 domain-containing protein n=1 Tax=Desulforapulum autotrophicum (strain ATCC 43914 / DSM 3382 / VKM B-1955 / HRM2) TaxID=177437 RepID=C0QDQ1_DESAH|nr:DUF4197 domain-containing protein [Desulforapulum autotrophicum]ACN17322.1 conserved hypothetical protein [Desulforapulum autotrophicum HRM2]
MAILSRIIIFLTVLSFTSPLSPADAGYKDLLKDFQSTIKPDAAVLPTTLSDDTIIKGLKEALATGSEKAVALVSKSDGYYKNPEIKIPLPPAVQKVETLLKAAGMTGLIDQFEQSMNRAAEQAAPQATELFVDAVKTMSFSDAKKILNGRDNEATLYFKDRTWDKLSERFRPVVHNTMAEVGVTRNFQELSAKTEAIPFAGTLDLDPDTYVTTKALDGLFLMLAKEEQKIRQDPAARVTDILKTVFNK